MAFPSDKNVDFTEFRAIFMTVENTGALKREQRGVKKSKIPIDRRKKIVGYLLKKKKISKKYFKHGKMRKFGVVLSN